MQIVKFIIRYVETLPGGEHHKVTYVDVYADAELIEHSKRLTTAGIPFAIFV